MYTSQLIIFFYPYGVTYAEIMHLHFPITHSSDTSVFDPEPQESFRSSLSLMISNTSKLLLTVISERADGPAEAEYDPVRPARPLLENKAGQSDKITLFLFY